MKVILAAVAGILWSLVVFSQKKLTPQATTNENIKPGSSQQNNNPQTPGLPESITQNYIEQTRICGGIDSMMKRKGNWKKVEDAITFPDKSYPRDQYSHVYSRIDKMLSFIHEACTDYSAIEPRWHRAMQGNSYIANGPVPYSFSSFYLAYYCNSNLNKLLLGDETSTWVYVFVNRLSWFLYEADKLDINDDGKIKTVFQLPRATGKWKGNTVYELKGSLSREARSVILGRKGKVPWRSITQKQYLTGLKNKFQIELKFPAGSGFEKEKKDKLRHINDYLAYTNEETLQQPAIIDPRSGIWGFKGSFGDEQSGGFRLVLFAASEKYFDRSLPRYAPQLIQLYWSYGKTPPELNFNKQFEENYPLEKLKAMIDK